MDFSSLIPDLPFDSWWFFGVVLALLIFAIGLVIRFVSSTNGDIDPVEIDRQMLSSVRELTRSGEITADEYRSIKSQLVARLAEDAKTASGEPGRSVPDIQSIQTSRSADPEDFEQSDDSESSDPSPS